MHEFVALTDDYLYRHPEIIDQLVPFQLDYPCRRQALIPLKDARPQPAPELRRLLENQGEQHE